MESRSNLEGSVMRVGAFLCALALVAVACGGDEPAEEPAAADVAGQEEPVAEETAPTEADEAAPSDGAAEGCEDGITARASHHLGEGNSGHQALLAMSEEIEQLTEGRIDLQVFPGAQLGGVAEMTENLRDGVIEFAWLDSSAISTFVPEAAALNLPFLFETTDQFHELIDGEVGREMDALIREEAGIEILYWSTVGFLYTFFAGDELVDSPEGFEGKAVRVAESPVFINTMRSLGAQAIDMPLGDVYTALQTGALDGYVLPYWATRDTSMYEVSDSVTEIGVSHGGKVIAVAPSFLDSLCEADAGAIRQAAELGEDIERTGWPEEDEMAREYLIENGIEVVPVDDFEVFRELVQPYWETFEEQDGGEIWERMKVELGVG